MAPMNEMMSSGRIGISLKEALTIRLQLPIRSFM
jgi:hypothetical protein